MKQERIVDAEIYQALHSNGYSSIKEVDEVVLETNGNLSVISELEGEITGIQV